MKNKLQSIFVLALVMSSAITVQAITVHVVPMAVKDGEWHVLLGLNNADLMNQKWSFFSADALANEQTSDAAERALQEKTYGAYKFLKSGATYKIENENYYIFYKAGYKPVAELNKSVPTSFFSKKPIIEFAWAPVSKFKQSNYKISTAEPASALLPVEPLAIFQKYLDDVIDEIKVPAAPSDEPLKLKATARLNKTLTELTNALTALKTALAS